MKFEYRNGLIWISIIVVYEDKQISIDSCILDTGSATTAIDIDLVDFNYQKPSFIRRLCGLGGGTQEVICQKVDKIGIDGKIMGNIDIEFGDIQSNLGINGFIGNDVLSKYSISIDYLHKDLEINALKP